MLWPLSIIVALLAILAIDVVLVVQRQRVRRQRPVRSSGTNDDSFVALHHILLAANVNGAVHRVDNIDGTLFRSTRSVQDVRVAQWSLATIGFVCL